MKTITASRRKRDDLVVVDLIKRLSGRKKAPAIHYRRAAGPRRLYDLIAAMQFNLLTQLGLREHHYLLDIGCGSLRAGRLFIPYLLPGRYFGIEPRQWALERGIKSELCSELIEKKKPSFSKDENFTLSTFKQDFDFILARSIFTHATQSQISRCFLQASKVMKPTSVFAATFLKGKRNNDSDKWTDKPVRYTMGFIRKTARENGLVCKEIYWEFMDSYFSSGEAPKDKKNRQAWLAIVKKGFDFSELKKRKIKVL